MKTTRKLLEINLRLFDGAGAQVSPQSGREGPLGGGDGAAAPGGEGAPAAEQQAGKLPGQGEPAERARRPPGGHGRRAKSGVTDGVIYGKTPEVPSDAGKDESGKADISVTTDEAAARQARFDELVRGEFKDLYDARVQDIVHRRLGDTQQLRGQMEAVSPILEALAQKYGVDAGDPAAIAAAVEKDDAYWEEAAEEAGMSVDQYRRFKAMERQNAQFQSMMQKQQARQETGRIMQQWAQQGEALREVYPGFDFEAEAQNPEFLKLLSNNVDVKTAYEVLHMDDIKTGVAATTAKAAERNVTETIRAKGMRPAENGAAPGSGVLVKNDVSKLTKADRAEIARRVARGEKIAF